MNHPIQSHADAAERLYYPLPDSRGGTPFQIFRDGGSATYEGLRYEARRTGRVDIRPLGVREPRGHVLLMNGYMMSPTSLISDKTMEPLSEQLVQHELHASSFAHAQRGGVDFQDQVGRRGIGGIQAELANDVRTQMGSILGGNHDLRPTGARKPVVLVGHSQGGQDVAYMLKNPEAYGLTRDQIRGAILINPMLLPSSPSMLRTPGFMTQIALRSLARVSWSIVSGQGFLLRGDDAFRTFVGEGSIDGKYERRLVDTTYPAEGLFFTQTVTTGTSPHLTRDDVEGLPISMIISQEDQLMASRLQHESAEHLSSLGANVHVEDVPGKHFSPIMTLAGESEERVDGITEANRRAFQHAMQRM